MSDTLFDTFDPFAATEAGVPIDLLGDLPPDDERGQYLRLSARVLDDPAVGDLIEEHGPLGIALLVAVMADAKKANAYGVVTVHPRQLTARLGADDRHEVVRALDTLERSGIVWAERRDGVVRRVRFRKWMSWQTMSDAERKRRTRAITAGGEEATGRMGYVYAMTANGRIKIGWSRNPWARFAQIRNSSGDPDATAIGHWAGTERDEAALHSVVATHRAAGEWFEDVPEVRVAIANRMAASGSSQVVAPTPRTTPDDGGQGEGEGRGIAEIEPTSPPARMSAPVREANPIEQIAEALVGLYPAADDLDERAQAVWSGAFMRRGQFPGSQVTVAAILKGVRDLTEHCARDPKFSPRDVVEYIVGRAKKFNPNAPDLTVPTRTDRPDDRHADIPVDPALARFT